MQGKPIYLDYNATTPVDPRVLEALLPYLQENFGNSASSQHLWGWTAQKAVEKARTQVANLLGAKPPEIYFTSGATESNNWVLQSLFYQFCQTHKPEKFHVLSCAIEHNSVVKTLEHLKKLGAQVDMVPVNKWGQVEPSEIEKRIHPETRLMSFIWINNEIGTINPVQEIGDLAQRYKIYFHSDATQAAGKVPIDLSKTKIDFLTLSAHKIYGPKGIGALYVRSKEPRIELDPLMHGGSHEKGLRSGTVNTPGVVGLGMACEIALNEMTTEAERIGKLRDQFLEDLKIHIPGVRLNGHPTHRAYNNLSLTFSGRRLDEALPFLMRLGFSTGSACHSGSQQGSHVLKGLGFSEDEMAATIRLSLGRQTTTEEIKEALMILKKAFAPSAEAET